MTIKLSDDTRQQAVSSIKRYFEEQMDEEIGDLKAGLLLEFFCEELGPSIYNAAIRQAQKRLQQHVLELDETCYEPEFSYWKP